MFQYAYKIDVTYDYKVLIFVEKNTQENNVIYSTQLQIPCNSTQRAN